MGICFLQNMDVNREKVSLYKKGGVNT